MGGQWCDQSFQGVVMFAIFFFLFLFMGGLSGCVMGGLVVSGMLFWCSTTFSVCSVNVFVIILRICGDCRTCTYVIHSLSNTCLVDWRVAVTCQVLFRKVSQKHFGNLDLVMCCHCTLEAGHLPVSLCNFVYIQCISLREGYGK